MTPKGTNSEMADFHGMAKLKTMRRAEESKHLKPAAGLEKVGTVKTRGRSRINHRFHRTVKIAHCSTRFSLFLLFFSVLGSMSVYG